MLVFVACPVRLCSQTTKNCCLCCIIVQVLVHAAAGGVGQAAVHIMAAAGSRVVATAGGPEKRMAVRALGVRAVAGSRDTGFAEALACGGTAGAFCLLKFLHAKLEIAHIHVALWCAETIFADGNVVV